MTDAIAPTLTLPHGAQMPRLGLGTWPLRGDDAEKAVAAAIDNGYRLIDTAENYENEEAVGRGIRASGVDRDEIFITTKFNKKWHGRGLVLDAFEASAERLGVDRIDLLLIHWPNPAEDAYVDAWRGMLGLIESGRVRAIGTSNFKPAHLQRIIDATGVIPDVNQIQLSPELIRFDARQYHFEHGIVTESWSPLGGQGAHVLDSPVIARIAEEHGRTPGQIVLRWHFELGLVSVPKSASVERMRENIAIFDFELTPQEVADISALDTGEENAADSDSFGH